jgi:dCMP deaminase
MNPINNHRLTEWAMGMAKHVAKLSKDPSTQVGAVIFDEKRRIVSAGYNGFARDVADTNERLENRDIKYRLTLHAEKNAILFANGSTQGATIVVTHPCCAQCAAQIIQAGIRHVIYPTPDSAFLDRWKDDLVLSEMQFKEAGVEVIEI